MNSQISSAAKTSLQETLIEKALAHYDAKEFDQARAVSNELLHLQPRDYSALHLAGVVATAQERLPEAAEFLKRALGCAPDAEKAAVSWFALGKALRQADDFRQAQEAFRRALHLNPEVCDYYLELANAYLEEWKSDLAIETLQTAIKRFSSDFRPYAALGDALHRDGRQQDALIAYELAIKLKPEYAHAHLAMGGALKTLGRFAEAEVEIRQALQLDPMSRAYSELVEFTKFEINSPEITKIKNRLDPVANAPLEARIDSMYALAKIYDDLGDYSTAFKYLEEACRLYRPTFEFSITDYEAMVDGIIALFTPDFLGHYSGKSTSDLAPIFIMGMPRSGTTLTEQIIASHSQVQGGGELVFMTRLSKQLGETWESRGSAAPGDDATVANDLVQAASYYRDMTEHLWRKKPRFTDKMPTNFLYLGVIQLLFPKASIIYCRRDAAATCFSCLQNYFTPGNVRFSYDLVELGRFYNLHSKIMLYWQKILPGRILEVQYENLVENTEAGVRRILDFCGLEFEPGCLDFHTLKRAVATASFMQVRKPVYKSSIEHWKHYEQFLGPLLETLKLESSAP